MQPAHDLDVQWLERMTSGLDEIDAGMNTVINDVHAIDFILCIEIVVEPRLDVFYYWPPRIVVVDKITKARSIYHCKTEANTVLFDVGAY